jgi:enediyne biosynthesis protein E3
MWVLSSLGPGVGSMGKLAKRVFGIDPGETLIARRGFRCDVPELRERLEGIGSTFVAGYHAALETDGTPALAARLAEVASESRGWAYEGAAMALALLDFAAPWRRRLDGLLHPQGPADPYIYLVHVGAGWALGRAPLSPARLLARLDPLLAWLALDGYGFHQGFFHAAEAIGERRVPPRTGFHPYARRAFDQGLGRSLWFVEGAHAARIIEAIEGFPKARRGDLWAGVGLAAAYAGGADRNALSALRAATDGCAADLAQGAAFAAKARQRAGTITPATELACAALCGRTAAAAAAATDEAMPGPAHPVDSALPAYEIWRRRTADLLAAPPTAGSPARRSAFREDP